MHTLNNRINLDRANSAADNISTGEKTMRNSSTKTPWHLRFAPGAILRQIGLAILALTMLVGVQMPEANAQISWEATRMTFVGAGPTQHLVLSGRVNGIGTFWTLTRIPLSRLRDTGLLAKIESINETLAEDLVSAMEKYEGDIDAMTARAVAAMANCLAQNIGVKFPGCTQRYLSSWDVEILFAIEELEDSVNGAVRRANSAAAALVISYSN